MIVFTEWLSFKYWIAVVVVACFFLFSHMYPFDVLCLPAFDGALIYNYSYLPIKKMRPWVCSLCLVGDLWLIPSFVSFFLFNILNELNHFVHCVWLLLLILFLSFRLRRTSANLPRRVWHLLKLVLYFVIPMVLLRSRVSLGARSCGFSRLMVCFPWLSIGADCSFLS